LTDFGQTWTSLASEASGRASGRVVRRVGPTEGPGSFLAIDCATKRRWVLIEIEADRRELHGLPDWREMKLAAIPKGQIHGQCVGIELESTEFADVFSAMAQDLVQALYSVLDREQRLIRLRDRLQKWSRFLREHGHQGLTEDQVRGLFSELWVLQQHLLPYLPPVEAIRAWTGPDGAAQDFRRADRALEVKSTGSKHPDAVAISNERQLDGGGLDALWLHVVALEDAGIGVSLPELVAGLKGRLRADAAASSSFDQKVVRAGYLDEAASRYPRRYEIADEATYEVREGFPRLIQPPAGVHLVRYHVSLAALQPFRVPLPASVKSFREGGV
jgi:hypothetical protein